MRKKQLLTWAVTQDDTFLNSSKSTPIFWVRRKLMLDEKREIAVSRIQNLDIKEEKGSFQLSATGQSIEEVSAEQKSNRVRLHPNGELGI